MADSAERTINTSRIFHAGEMVMVVIIVLILVMFFIPAPGPISF